MFFTLASWHAGNTWPFPPLQLAPIEGLFHVHPQVLIAAIEQYYSTRKPTSGVPDYSDPGAARSRRLSLI